MNFISKMGAMVMAAAVITSAAAEKAVKKIVFIGDSISYGVGSSAKENRFTTMTVRLLNDSGDGITYTEKNTAVSGSTFCQSSWPAEKISAYPDRLRYIIATKPDIVVLQHGVNDQTAHSSIGDFGWSYRQFVREAKAALPDTAFFCLTITPTNRKGEMAQFHDITNTIIQEVAAKEGISVVQINQALDGRLDLFPDGLHPNDAGHRIMAETLAKAIRENRRQEPGKFDFVMRRAGHYRIMGYIITVSEAAAKAGMSCFYGISKDEFCYSSYGPVTLDSPFRLYLEPVKCQSASDIAVPAGTWNEYRRALTVKLPATGGKVVKVKIVPAGK